MIATPSGEVGEYTSSSRSGSSPAMSRCASRKVVDDASPSSRTVIVIPGSTSPSSGLAPTSDRRSRLRNSWMRASSARSPGCASSASSSAWSRSLAAAVIQSESFGVVIIGGSSFGFGARGISSHRLDGKPPA
jgi:hypothetical protein